MDFASKIRKAIECLSQSGVIILPTETVYGVAADAFNPAAVKKLRRIKRRVDTQPFQLLCSSPQQIEEYAAELSPLARLILKKYTPGPWTFILRKNTRVLDFVTGSVHSVGVRVPKHAATLKLLKKWGKPLAASSANRAGEPPPRTAQAAFRNLPEVDYVLDAGPARLGRPSTIIDLTQDPPRVLRGGPIRFPTSRTKTRTK